MRFIIDTNIFIQLEDSVLSLGQHFSSFSKLAQSYGHELVCHPASISDIKRDKNITRRDRMLERLKKYPLLEVEYLTTISFDAVKPNDVCDDQILYSLQCEAAHYLVTQDQGIHKKALKTSQSDRVLTIQQAVDLLSRLHLLEGVQLPSIHDVEMFNLVPILDGDFFDSLREGYKGFDDWFRSKAKDGRRTWLYRGREQFGCVSALCIYAIQVDEIITDEGFILPGRSLKLCTFKVAEEVRGRKVGELLLKAAFRYASDNKLENIFVHTNSEGQEFLVKFLQEFGFELAGRYSETEDVYVKKHPVIAPPKGSESETSYLIKYFPHYLSGSQVRKHLVPIQPHYHELLFPDYEYADQQVSLFSPAECDVFVGNSIKQAYLCHSNTNKVSPGDVLLFYRSQDLQAVTSVGVVEYCSRLSTVDEIIRLVKRRTVYSYSEIAALSEEPTKVILFRLVEHLPSRVSLDWLLRESCVNTAPISIMEVTDDAYRKIVEG
jgi:GNAT superfamily N-acetyltransferase